MISHKCMEEFQDSLNDAINENNSPTKTLMHLKIFYGKQHHGGNNEKEHQDAGEVNKEINGEQLFYYKN